jgi:hypothetical protein
MALPETRALGFTKERERDCPLEGYQYPLEKNTEIFGAYLVFNDEPCFHSQHLSYLGSKMANTNFSLPVQKGQDFIHTISYRFSRNGDA